MRTPILVRASCFAGLIASSLLAGCALLPDRWQQPEPPRQNPVDLLLDTPPDARQALWESLAEQPDAELARALMRSLSGHSGFAPQRALQDIRNLLQDPQLGEDERRLLRLRALGLEREIWLAETLRQRDERLRSLIEIERRMSNMDR